MSSLNAARADNFYYPPEYEPGKTSAHNAHPLGDRAKMLDKGVMVIRFEMPFSVWCDTCNSHIGRGVRYNARKKCIGKYFSSKIWEFSMLCVYCSGVLAIKTDPQNSTYVCVKGCRQQNPGKEPAEGTILLPDKEEKAKLDNDIMYRLEHGVDEKNKAKKQMEGVRVLAEFQERAKHEFEDNQLLRSIFRAKKKAMGALAVEAKAKGLGIALLPHNEADAAKAETVQFRAAATTSILTTRIKRLQQHNTSIFGTEYSGKAHKAQLQALASSVTHQLQPSKLRALDTSPALATPMATLTRSFTQADIQAARPSAASVRVNPDKGDRPGRDPVREFHSHKPISTTAAASSASLPIFFSESTTSPALSVASPPHHVSTESRKRKLDPAPFSSAGLAFPPNIRHSPTALAVLGTGKASSASASAFFSCSPSSSSSSSCSSSSSSSTSSSSSSSSSLPPAESIPLATLSDKISSPNLQTYTHKSPNNRCTNPRITQSELASVPEAGGIQSLSVATGANSSTCSLLGAAYGSGSDSEHSFETFIS
jgi:coiled-coil domain-containing protein 130